MATQRYRQQQVIDALTETKGLVTFAAQRLGCVPNTVYAYVDRYPKVRAARDAARERQLDVTEAALFRAIGEGELPAITFYLRTVGRHRGYGDRLELDATVDVLQTPGWLRTRTLLLEVLRSFPEAQMAVVTRLRALEAPPEDDVDGGAEDAG
jgi:hypothetical protein